MYRIVVLFIVAFVYDSDALTKPFFREDYVFNPKTEFFYKVHSDKKNWNDAINSCKLEGTNLFVPKTKVERDIVKDLVDKKFPKTSDLPMYPWVWIDLHDNFAEGEFGTFDGRFIDDFFIEWDDMEPNDQNNEDCVAMRRTGKMNDLACDVEAPFVCTKPLSTLDWNTLCDLPDTNYLYNKELGKCYKLHLTPKNWADAYAVCTAEESYLAIINSRAEADHIVRIVDVAPKDNIKTAKFFSTAVYLGFHNHIKNGWTTVKGQRLGDVGYTKWANGQPDNSGGDDRCGSMFFDGGLNDLTCSLTAIFICEHDIGFHSSDSTRDSVV